MKVVLNQCFGGFSLSEIALAELGTEYSWGWSGQRRADPKLVEVVERLGSAANGALADLHIVEIPDGIDWFVMDHDGVEWVVEKGHTWPPQEI